ncbi:MAG TPA: hypothetical protein VGD00_00250 [Solirubrobacteraceae bacterium]|jgi:hypothetical protein
MRARHASALLAICLAGCGAQPPQAPTAYANRVASALEGITLACGENAQQRALPQFGPPSRAPESEAAERALELAHVVKHNPAWVYQGSTLEEVAASAAERLHECGLGAAARPLRRRG